MPKGHIEKNAKVHITTYMQVMKYLEGVRNMVTILSVQFSNIFCYIPGPYIFIFIYVLCSFFTIPPSISPLHPILLQHYHCDVTPSSPLPIILSLASHHLSFFSTCSPPFLQSPSFITQLSPFSPHDSLSLSNTQLLCLSCVSCELQSHVSRVSSASNRAGRLCLVLLTDRNTHTHTNTHLLTKSRVGLHSWTHSPPHISKGETEMHRQTHK